MDETLPIEEVLPREDECRGVIIDAGNSELLARPSTGSSFSMVARSFLDLEVSVVDRAFRFLLFPCVRRLVAPDEVRGIVFDGSMAASFRIRNIKNQQ